MNHLASGPGKITYTQTSLELSRQWKCEHFSIKKNEQLQAEINISLKGIDDGAQKVYDISSATRGTVDKLTAITKQLQLRLKVHERVVREKKALREERVKPQDKYTNLKNKSKAAELEDRAKKINSSPPTKKVTH